MRLPTLALPAAPLLLGLLGSLAVAALQSLRRPVPVPLPVRGRPSARSAASRRQG